MRGSLQGKEGKGGGKGMAGRWALASQNQLFSSLKTEHNDATSLCTKNNNNYNNNNETERERDKITINTEEI